LTGKKTEAKDSRSVILPWTEAIFYIHNKLL